MLADFSNSQHVPYLKYGYVRTQWIRYGGYFELSNKVWSLELASSAVGLFSRRCSFSKLGGDRPANICSRGMHLLHKIQLSKQENQF